MLPLLLLLTLPVTFTERIPSELLERLKAAHSLAELHRIAPIHYSRTVAGQGGGRGQRVNLQYSHDRRLLGADILGRSRSRNDDQSGIIENDSVQQEQAIVLDDTTSKSLEVLRDLRQGNDTCELRSLCLPVPLDAFDPSIVVFPRCFEVARCVGSCCDSEESCHPTAFETIELPVAELQYIGDDRFLMTRTSNITLQRHLACACRDCAAHGPPKTCPHNRLLGPSCRCECRNQMEKQKCAERGLSEWNEVSCECECRVRACAEGRWLNRERCECEQFNGDDDGETVGSHSGMLADSSGLPKLTSNNRRGSGSHRHRHHHQQD